MKKIKRRWLATTLKIFAVCMAISFVWSLVSFFRPGDKFVGSPPSQGLHRNNMDLSYHGAWWGKYGKQFRTHSYTDFFGPSLFAAPIIHYFSGWDVYGNICVEAKIIDLQISDDDGDILIPLLLEPKDIHYGWRKSHPKDKSNGRNWILVEIDDPIRDNFPILPDLGVGDKVKICGRWVYDRAHDHNEIHPANWVEIKSFAEAIKK
ncbi:MAG: hypothetical protein UT67_C0001G0021 [Candidatus Magasanikbacteria bacterium GW2011_GWA2_40_10]|uniref:Uncharacterized protein n=1 Tax=Candidatus Magasanikbacteria bacterium GW2011_GWA2_40_10 TaxID=1619037 RepID=A0A0G0QDX2_9BACT|nr:MAG: hypothetical protein UT67_C0001G0021 [Candidatus Magasanikbacteria bacterium GW2011_GWA2_40_10]